MMPFKKRMLIISPPADTVADYPEPLIHNIISFLPPKSFAQLCIVSKRFLSACNSTPYLSFEYPYNAGGEEKEARFLDYIQSTINRRPRGINLEKLRIKSKRDLDDYRIYSAINYAIDCGVRAIDLKFCDQFKLSPLRILSAAASLTSLRLECLDLNPRTCSGGVLAISHPLLEDLKFSLCKGFQTIKISCGKLKSLDFKSCQMLEFLDIDPQTSNLESFRVRTINNGTVNFSPTCPSMKLIFLSHVVINEVWVTQLLSKLPNLESIRLFQCELEGEMISVLHDNLKDVDLDILSRNSVSAAVRGQKLESTSLSYRSVGYGVYKISNLAGFESLQSLKLSNTSTTDEWLESNVSSLVNLKSLEVIYCHCLKKMSISSNSLESLAITSCEQLDKVDTCAAANLNKFELSCCGKPLEELVLGSSGKLLFSIMISICLGSFYLEWPRQLLKAFGQSKKLIFMASSTKCFLIPESSRERRIDPWYNLRTMEVDIDAVLDKATGDDIVDLFSSMLWLAPRLEAITVVSVNGGDSIEEEVVEVVKTVKLKYYEEGDLDEEEEVKLISTCCEPWRHSLKELTMENLDAQEKEDTVQFFMRNSRSYRDNMLHQK